MKRPEQKGGAARGGAVSGRTALLIGLWLGMAFVYLLNPVFDVDVFWQIRLGQLMRERRALVTEDPFTYTHAGQPVPTIGWLAQLGLAGAHGLGGWPLVHLLNALLLAAAFAVAGWSAMSHEGGRRPSLVAVACAVVLGFLVSLSNCDVRPQSFGLLCFALFLHVCGTGRPWPRRVPLLALILVVWQNSHPSMSLAMVAAGALAAGTALERRRGRPGRSVRAYAGGLALAGVSQLATPMGFGIFAVSARNVEVSRLWLGVSEWLPPWSEPVRAPMAMFWVALAFSLALMIRLRRQLRWDDALLFIAATAVALSAARFGLFWGLAMVPVWARWFEEGKPPHLLRWRGEARLAGRPCLLAGVVGLVVLLAVPPRLRGSLMHAELPVQGVARLERALPQGRVYNFREWGGPLILAGSPRWQVAMDGRLYVFDRADWREYFQAARGEIPLGALLARHRPDAFFLSPRHQRGLVRQIREARGWREVYADPGCVMLVRRHARHGPEREGRPPASGRPAQDLSSHGGGSGHAAAPGR
ncbi:MAG: hypothetical protein HY321_01385 [Armatimonadetes bacterium]|nr:hypothetical protein [Armatimonadota bacterium]